MDMERIYTAGYTKGHSDGMKTGIMIGAGLVVTGMVVRKFRQVWNRATNDN